MKWIVSLVAIVFVTAEFTRYLTLSQKNGYKLPLGKVFCKELVFVSVFSLLSIIPFYYVSIAVYLVGAVTVSVMQAKRRAKLIITRRALSYLVLSLLMAYLPIIICAVFLSAPLALLPAVASSVIISFIFIIVTERILGPYYEKKNRKFIRGVADKFSKTNVKLIAITGSFGKTCCKNILRTLLSGRYNVAVTFGNYNTPMGVALSMQTLNGDEDFFIAEFGARQKGDITELCSYFQPEIGVITGVTNQHVGVFGSLHVIYNEKYQLAKMLNKEGFCAFGSELYAKKMYREYTGNKITVGACEDIYAENVNRLIGKTTFCLHIHEKSAVVTTRLCGKQAVENILLCVAVADKIGLEAEIIFDRIPLIEQVPHRLEYSFVNGVHILDDSYNSNIVGVGYAFDYLRIYPSPRIVVAQGVVEMGINQKEENILIGEKIARVADVVVLLGVNKKAIRRGLLQVGYRGTIIQCRSFKEVTSKIKSYLCPGATVLFQNDVPEVF